MPLHVNRTRGNRRFGDHGVGHRRDGGGQRVRGGPPLPEPVDGRRHPRRPGEVAQPPGREGQDDRGRAGRGPGRVTGTSDLGALKDVDLVIESVVEDLAVKKELFNELDRITGDGTILATNTSTLPVIELAMQTGRPDKVCGVHFFNPAPMMELVELVRPLTASDETLASARQFAEACGKTPVEVKDQAGFIVNALLFPYLNNAVRLYEQGVASIADIDTAMKGGCGFPMGPFALLDLVGLDTSLAILDALYDEFRDPELRRGAPAAPDGGGRAAGPQVGPGIPRLSEVGLAGNGRSERPKRERVRVHFSGRRSGATMEEVSGLEPEEGQAGLTGAPDRPGPDT